MNVKHTNAPEFEAMVGQRLLNAPDQTGGMPGLDPNPAHPSKGPPPFRAACNHPAGRPLGIPGSPVPALPFLPGPQLHSHRSHAAALQPGPQDFDSGLYKGEVRLEITQEEALQLAPMLMPTIQELVREDLPEELQDRPVLDEMNYRAVRALSEIPQGEYAALAEATLKLIQQEDSTHLDLETGGTPT